MPRNIGPRIPPYVMKRHKKKQSKVATKKNLEQTILKVINRKAEVKNMTPLFFRGNRALPYLSDNVTQCVPLTPIVAQGAGQGERIGNEITTRKAILSLNMSAISISTSSGYVPPIYFDIYIYKFKRSDSVTAIDLTNFLQYGNVAIEYDSTTIPESGNLKVNNDAFTLKYRKRVLLWNQNVSQQSVPSGLALTNCSNVLNAKNMNIDITKYLSKTMKFNDGVANTPADNLYISVVCTPNDQNTGYDPTTIFGTFDVMLQYRYDDL